MLGHVFADNPTEIYSGDSYPLIYIPLVQLHKSGLLSKSYWAFTKGWYFFEFIRTIWLSVLRQGYLLFFLGNCSKSTFWIRVGTSHKRIAFFSVARQGHLFMFLPKTGLFKINPTKGFEVPQRSYNHLQQGHLLYSHDQVSIFTQSQHGVIRRILRGRFQLIVPQG